MQPIVFDLEATCWEKQAPGQVMEIIEIGAVRLEPRDFLPLDEFDQLVKPMKSQSLSEFCTQLTGLKQTQVDQAPGFPVAFEAFLDWIGPDDFWLLSWGAYDLEQLTADCKLHGLELPPRLKGHTNLKEPFAAMYSTRPGIGLKRSLAKVGLRFEGRQHRGIDDARNIAALARVLRPILKVG